MRYAIIGATIQQVIGIGGTNVKEARRTGIIFATLDKAQVGQLEAAGCQVTKVGKIGATIMPPPPPPAAAAPIYSPEQLVVAAGLEDLRELTDPPLYGSGFNLAIVDSGIRESHEKVNGRVIYRKNYTADPMQDGYNHGTNVCSIALNLAPLCNILNLKVLDNEGMGTEEEVVLAIDDCIDLHDTRPEIAPTVINLSLGAPDDGNPNNPLRVACRAAIEEGIWVVAAAGNDGPEPSTILSPACERYVVAIGSAKYEPFQVSGFSSRGPTAEGLSKPDVIMFGEDIIMASSISDTATIAKSGTSFSTPFTSAMALLYHEGLYRQARTTEQLVGLPPEEMYFVSVEEAIDTYFPLLCIKPEGIAAGKDYDYGYGLPYGPFIAQAIGLRPAIDISSMLMPMLMIGMLGMVTTVMTKAAK